MKKQIMNKIESKLRWIARIWDIVPGVLVDIKKKFWG